MFLKLHTEPTLQITGKTKESEKKSWKLMTYYNNENNKNDEYDR